MKTKKFFMSISFFLFLILFSSLCFAQTQSQLFQQALLKENGEGDLKAAVEIYQKIVDDENADRSLRAKAQLHIGMCWEKMGMKEAIKAYQKVIEEYQDQVNVANEAREKMKKYEAEKKVSKSEIRPKYKKLFQTNSWISSADCSPSGKWIAYVSYPGNIFLLERGTSVERELFHNISTGWGWLRFSPDGKYLSFLSSKTMNRKESFKESYLWLIPFDSETGVMKGKPALISDTLRIQRFYWHPDNKKICCLAYSHKNKRKLAIIQIENRKVEWLNKLPDTWNFQWSRDGKYIIYGKNDLFRYHLKTKEVEKILSKKSIFEISLNGNYFLRTIKQYQTPQIELFKLNNKSAKLNLRGDFIQPQRGTFFPEGNRLLLISTETNSTIKKINLIDNSISQISKKHGEYYNPFVRPQNDFLIYDEITAQEKSLHKLNLKSGTESLIPLNEIFSLRTWSPDGKYIAYAAWKDKLPIKELKLYNFFTGESRLLAEHNEISYGKISWASNSKYLSYCYKEEGRNYIRIIDLNGREFFEISNKDRLSTGNWSSRDNIYLFCKKTENGSSQLVSYSVEKKIQEVLLETELQLETPLFSPNGKFIIFAGHKQRVSESQIYRFSTDNKNMKLIGPEKPIIIDKMYWMPDNINIAVLGFLLNSEQYCIWLINTKNGELKNLAADEGSMIIYSISVSPDGSSIYYDTDDWTNSALWEVDISEAIEKLK